MVIVACLLLPFVGMLLYGMDRVEDWLTRSPAPRPPRRHAGGRHLWLIHGGRQERRARQAGQNPADPAGASVPAARSSDAA